jgi:hypothetical protein
VASPASVLGLSKNWKLTLPTGGSEDPTEILQPRLATYSDPYFKVSGDHVLFTAKCGGVTTSKSGYPRSELREMASNGTKKAAWSNRSGTHIMTLDQAFMHLPDKRPHCVAGQVHDALDDVTVCRLEGNKLWATKGDNTHFHLLDSNYVLGTRFTITFEATSGGIHIDYNAGEEEVTVPGNFNGCYFKAGVYPQSNPAKWGESPSAYGQVAIWDVIMGPLPPKPVRPVAPTPPPPENPCGG